MVNSNIWKWYDKPPTICTTCVGNTFQHRDHGTKVKVLSTSLLVDYTLRDNEREEIFGDVPGMSTPLVSFEILTGQYAGQNLTMAIGTFLRYFSLLV
jgi:hypothetical protein